MHGQKNITRVTPDLDSLLWELYTLNTNNLVYVPNRTSCLHYSPLDFITAPNFKILKLLTLIPIVQITATHSRQDYGANSLSTDPVYSLYLSKITENKLQTNISY
jgi:hypothetical protein